MIDCNETASFIQANLPVFVIFTFAFCSSHENFFNKNVYSNNTQSNNNACRHHHHRSQCHRSRVAPGPNAAVRGSCILSASYNEHPSPIHTCVLDSIDGITNVPLENTAGTMVSLDVATDSIETGRQVGLDHVNGQIKAMRYRLFAILENEVWNQCQV